MATFTRVPMVEARMSAMPAKRAAQEQYRAYIRQLGDGQAGRLELGPDDKSTSERARLKAAAKAENVSLEIQRTGTTIVFWRRER